MWPEVLRGYSTGRIRLEGQINTDADDYTDGPSAGLSNGLFVTLDLILVKGTPWGYDDVYGLIVNYTPGTTIENQAASFTCEIMTSGIVSRAEVVT